MVPEPGKFSCPKCGCNKFLLVVHFDQEGSGKFDYILCYDCMVNIPEEQAKKMLKEII